MCACACVRVWGGHHSLPNNSNAMDQGHGYKSLPTACGRQPHHACSLSGLGCWEGGCCGNGGWGIHWPLWQDIEARGTESMCVCNWEACIDIPPPRVHRSRLKWFINFHLVMGCEGKKKRCSSGQSRAELIHHLPLTHLHTHTHTNLCIHTCMHLEIKLLLDRSWKKVCVFMCECACLFDKLRLLERTGPEVSTGQTGGVNLISPK